MREKRGSKGQLRLKIRKRLRTLSLEQIRQDSSSIRKQIRFQPGDRIALFAGTALEPQLLPLINDHPEVEWYLPKVLDDTEMQFLRTETMNDLEKGRFGIMEPSQGEVTNQLDLIVCPGLAFTNAGRRLGQGGGFYDRALPCFPEATLVGVAFECQLMPDLPCDPHDIKMDAVVTPLRERSV